MKNSSTVSHESKTSNGDVPSNEGGTTTEGSGQGGDLQCESTDTQSEQRHDNIQEQ